MDGIDCFQNVKVHHCEQVYVLGSVFYENYSILLPVNQIIKDILFMVLWDLQ